MQQQIWIRTSTICSPHVNYYVWCHVPAVGPVPISNIRFFRPQCSSITLQQMAGRGTLNDLTLREAELIQPSYLYVNCSSHSFVLWKWGLRRINCLRKVCNHSVQNPLSSRLLSST
jgi:hypothetical protein